MTNHYREGERDLLLKARKATSEKALEKLGASITKLFAGLLASYTHVLPTTLQSTRVIVPPQLGGLHDWSNVQAPNCERMHDTKWSRLTQGRPLGSTPDWPQSVLYVLVVLQLPLTA